MNGTQKSRKTRDNLSLLFTFAPARFRLHLPICEVVLILPNHIFNRIRFVNVKLEVQIPSCIHLPALLSYTSYHLNAIYAIGKRKLLGNGRHNGVRKC